MCVCVCVCVILVTYHVCVCMCDTSNMSWETGKPNYISCNSHSYLLCAPLKLVDNNESSTITLYSVVHVCVANRKYICSYKHWDMNWRII